uniref:Uncharacterized protein n=1 Tax=Rhizophora mucronata TaxID=61149 RepID=A0A2P2K6V2_RHIMU
MVVCKCCVKQREQEYITERKRQSLEYRYLRRQREAAICGNAHRGLGHRARQIYQSEFPYDSPIAGSRRCGDWRGSTVSCCGNSVPSLYCSSSRISSTSSPIKPRHQPRKT